jgi:hypothetical protein
MAEARLGYNEKIPEEIRDICADLCDDVTALHVKWSFYRELFATRENTDALSNLARAFFQTVEEALRTDLLTTICRLSDPNRSLGRVNLSFAPLVGKCADLPRVDDLVTAFQAACGNVRLYRNRYVGHNKLSDPIEPAADLLPGVSLSQIDEILHLGREILRTIYAHYAQLDLVIQPAYRDGPQDLLDWIKKAQASSVGM